MPALWLAQLLCPQRHAICALAYDLEETPAAEIEARLLGLLAHPAGLLNPWCGICGAKVFHVEHGKLPSDDWDEQVPRLKEAERANLAARQVLGEPGRN